MTPRRLSVLFLLCGPILFFASCKKKTTSTASSTESPSTAWSINFSTVDSTLPMIPSTRSIYGASAPDGALYVSSQSSGSFVIRKSSDKGASWTTVDTYSSQSQGLGIDVDSAGRVFAVGWSRPSGYFGLIRRSTDNGATWSSVYEGQIYSGQTTTMVGVTHDSADRIFAVGYSRFNGIYHFVTLRSVDHGVTWTQVDDYAPDGFRFGAPAGVLVASSGKIYVWTNSTSDGDGTQVRMSSDHGDTWRTIYQGWGQNIGSIAEWSNGLVMSQTITSTNPPTWQIAGTPDDFAHVDILEGISPAGSTGTYAGDLKVDSRGYLYGIGYNSDADSRTTVIVMGTRGDGTYSTLDTYPSDINYGAYNGELFFDKADGIYYGAALNDATTTTMVIRKGIVSSSGTFTPASIAAGSDLVNPIPAGAKRMFLSAKTNTGVFGVSESAAIVAADAICNADANKPVGSGTYKALLVNSSRIACTTPFCSGGNAEHTDWVLSPTTQYVRTDGTSIGTSDANGLFTTFDHQISAYNNDQPWIGLSFYLDWTIQTDDPDNSNFYCNGWVSSSGYGGAWAPNESDFSGAVYAAYPNLCTEQHPVLCVEQ